MLEHTNTCLKIKTRYVVQVLKMSGNLNGQEFEF